MEQEFKRLYDAAMKADYTQLNGADELCKILDFINYNEVFGGE